MEVYILDSLYRRNLVVDKFESLIWTERMRAFGDFELLLHSTLENRARFLAGTNLALNESYRVMTVETVEDTTDDEGRSLLLVKGRSLEAILESRVARGAMDDLTAAGKWIVTGLPLDIAAQLFHDICVTGILDAGDIISGITEDSIFPIDTIAAPSEEIIYEMDIMTLYKAIKDLCEVYDMGFRIVRDPMSSALYFDVYMGSDRTTSQTTLPSVVFSPDLENLKNTTHLTSIKDYKNVAYVFSPVGFEVVYAQDVDTSVAGFDRRVLFIKADDITDTDPEVASAQMIQRGKEELAKNRRFSGFDGELTQKSQYRYDVDYYLGDLVELRNDDGVTSNMQVTEQIFVSDKEGERSYPTLAINTFITPGSWSAWDYNQVWEEIDIDEEWDDQP